MHFNFSIQEQQFGGEEFNKVKAALSSTHAVYLSLQELYANFGNIILPEAVKNIQLGEPTVVATLSSLDQLITSLPESMQTIQNQMQRLLTNAMFGIEVKKLFSEDKFISEYICSLLFH